VLLNSDSTPAAVRIDITVIIVTRNMVQTLAQELVEVEAIGSSDIRNGDIRVCKYPHLLPLEPINTLVETEAFPLDCFILILGELEGLDHICVWGWGDED
jgi:hypothetical protein